MKAVGGELGMKVRQDSLVDHEGHCKPCQGLTLLCNTKVYVKKIGQKAFINLRGREVLKKERRTLSSNCL